MFGGLQPEMMAAMKAGLEWEKAHPEAMKLPWEDRCVNWMAPECIGLAGPNGWCSGCWALIDPGAAAPALDRPITT